VRSLKSLSLIAAGAMLAAGSALGTGTAVADPIANHGNKAIPPELLSSWSRFSGFRSHLRYYNQLKMTAEQVVSCPKRASVAISPVRRVFTFC